MFLHSTRSVVPLTRLLLQMSLFRYAVVLFRFSSYLYIGLQAALFSQKHYYGELFYVSSYINIIVYKYIYIVI